jgi:hypothetical protein
MTDYTTDHRIKLETYLASCVLSRGLGRKESACTLAAINLAMSGELTDKIPACMSKVLGSAAVELQDAMPDEMRNSLRYKSLIPDMPGTGRAQEQERLSVLLDWLWSVVLPQLHIIAEKGGFGDEWRTMCQDRTADAARGAANAAWHHGDRADAADVAVIAAVTAAARAADAATIATTVVNSAAAVAAYADSFWSAIDPIGVLERMTYLTGDKT